MFETDTAVIAAPVEVALDSPDNIRLAHLQQREVVVRLAAPLGNRVLIWLADGAGSDTCGAPRTVITAAETTHPRNMG